MRVVIILSVVLVIDVYLRFHGSSAEAVFSVADTIMGCVAACWATICDMQEWKRK